MTSLVLVRLGEGDYAEGRATMYALLDDDGVREIVPASNDDQALAKARELAAERTVECEPALAEVARRRSATTRELTAFEKVLKAHSALRLFAKDTYRGGKQGPPLMDFLEAADVFAKAVASDDRDQWFLAGTVRGTVAEAAVDRDLFFLVRPGREPGVSMLARSDADQVFASDAQIRDFDHIVVELVPDPQLVPILTDAYGLTLLPRASVVERGQARSPDNGELDLLAAVLTALGRYAESKVIGFAYSPRAGGRLEVRLAAYTAAS